MQACSHTLAKMHPPHVLGPPAKQRCREPTCPRYCDGSFAVLHDETLLSICEVDLEKLR